MPVILIVDDEPLQREILGNIMSDEGYETYTAPSAEDALEKAAMVHPDVVLSDLKMKKMDGIALMEKLKDGSGVPAVIIMTAFGSVSTAVEAMKKGAFDYLTKPLDKEMVLLTVKRALNTVALLKKNRELQNVLYNKFSIEGIVGGSLQMQEVVRMIKKAGDTPVTVLVLGESGTGKELVARAIHYNGLRAARPFTAVNCAAIPENLIESELFGYEPGAFTGANSRHPGLFEISNGGTIFLDEIGDLPLHMQSKILRVIQEKEVRRLGGRESIKIDVRVVAATNKDLEKEMRSGRFREDLYYRLRVVSIELPPLRERKGDITELANYFLAKYNKEFGRRIKSIGEPAMKAFISYHWPGNIRQLESVIERAVVMCDSDSISLKDIKGELRQTRKEDLMEMDIPDEGIDFDELEKSLLIKSMEKSNNVAARAAKLLGMSYKTFLYRWEKINEGQGKTSSGGISGTAGTAS